MVLGDLHNASKASQDPAVVSPVRGLSGVTLPSSLFADPCSPEDALELSTEIVSNEYAKCGAYIGKGPRIHRVASSWSFSTKPEMPACMCTIARPVSYHRKKYVSLLCHGCTTDSSNYIPVFYLLFQLQRYATAIEK